MADWELVDDQDDNYGSFRRGVSASGNPFGMPTGYGSNGDFAGSARLSRRDREQLDTHEGRVQATIAISRRFGIAADEADTAIAANGLGVYLGALTIMDGMVDQAPSGRVRQYMERQYHAEADRLGRAIYERHRRLSEALHQAAMRVVEFSDERSLIARFLSRW